MTAWNFSVRKFSFCRCPNKCFAKFFRASSWVSIFALYFYRVFSALHENWPAEKIEARNINFFKRNLMAAASASVRKGMNIQKEHFDGLKIFQKKIFFYTVFSEDAVKKKWLLGLTIIILWATIIGSCLIRSRLIIYSVEALSFFFSFYRVFKTELNLAFLNLTTPDVPRFMLLLFWESWAEQVQCFDCKDRESIFRSVVFR